jgi:hypothetical protein
LTDYHQRKRLIQLLGGLACTALAGCAPPEAPAVDDGPRPSMIVTGQLQSEEIVEASGLARSQRDPGLLWTMNDGGSKPRLYALGEAGLHRGRIKLEEAKNRDWEDLSSFSIGEQAYLLVADIGDNDARRKHVQLLVVPEPDLSLDNKVKVEPAWKVDFEYPDGPRDAEAVAADPDNQRVLVLTKRTLPPELYAVPLMPGDGRVKAEFLGTIESLPAPTRNDVHNAGFTKDWHWQPTAMDLSPDGRLAVILTYRAIYVYRLDPAKSLFENLNGTAYALGLGNFPNAESVAFSADNGSIFVTVEGRRAPVMRIDINGALPE